MVPIIVAEHCWKDVGALRTNRRSGGKVRSGSGRCTCHQYVYLEALAIQDWIKHVLEPAGRAAEAAAPLAAAMETLGIGRREQVTELMASYAAL